VGGRRIEILQRWALLVFCGGGYTSASRKPPADPLLAHFFSLTVARRYNSSAKMRGRAVGTAASKESKCRSIKRNLGFLLFSVHLLASFPLVHRISRKYQSSPIDCIHSALLGVHSRRHEAYNFSLCSGHRATLNRAVLPKYL